MIGQTLFEDDLLSKCQSWAAQDWHWRLQSLLHLLWFERTNEMKTGCLKIVSADYWNGTQKLSPESANAVLGKKAAGDEILTEKWPGLSQRKCFWTDAGRCHLDLWSWGTQMGACWDHFRFTTLSCPVSTTKLATSIASWVQKTQAPFMCSAVPRCSLFLSRTNCLHTADVHFRTATPIWGPPLKFSSFASSPFFFYLLVSRFCLKRARAFPQATGQGNTSHNLRCTLFILF